MKRKITISIPTVDEEIRVDITPTGKDTVMISTEAPKFAVNAEELKAALDEAEKYRKEFEEKEKNTEVRLEGTAFSTVVENE